MRVCVCVRVCVNGNGSSIITLAVLVLLLLVMVMKERGWTERGTCGVQIEGCIANSGCHGTLSLTHVHEQASWFGPAVITALGL